MVIVVVVEVIVTEFGSISGSFSCSRGISSDSSSGGGGCRYL